MAASIEVTGGLTYEWDMKSTYVQNPPYFVDLAHDARSRSPTSSTPASSACSSIRSPPTTSRRPARSSATARRAAISPSMAWTPHDFNSYGSRRGNHEVMMRGTFANTRIKNQMVPGIEGGVTLHYPSGRGHERSTTRRCAMGRGRAARDLRRQGIWHRLLARLGGEGPRLLGVRAVIAESFERIHRSNLIGMGVLPLVFAEGMSLADDRAEGSGDRDLAGLGRDQAQASGSRPTSPMAMARSAPCPLRAPHRYVRRARLFPQRRHSALRAARPRARSRLAPTSSLRLKRVGAPQLRP